MSYQDWVDSGQDQGYEAQTGQSNSSSYSGYNGSSYSSNPGYSNPGHSNSNSGYGSGNSGTYSGSNQPSYSGGGGGYSNPGHSNSGYGSGNSGTYSGSNQPSYPGGGGGGNYPRTMPMMTSSVQRPAYEKAYDLLYKEHKQPNVYTGPDRQELQKIKHANDKPTKANNWQKDNPYYGDDDKTEQALAWMIKLKERKPNG
jgi:hypothetical protein